jgi:hypothetical protein
MISTMVIDWYASRKSSHCHQEEKWQQLERLAFNFLPEYSPRTS